MTRETRSAYVTGQCYALADALAESMGDEGLVGVTILNSQDTIPWGTRIEEASGSLRADWFNKQAIHAVAIDSDSTTYVDVGGRQDMDILREQTEDLHNGSLVIGTRQQVRDLLRTAPLCFPQDYDTARLVVSIVPEEG